MEKVCQFVQMQNTGFMNQSIITLSIGVDRPEQTVKTQICGSDQGLHCLPLIKQFFDTCTGSKIEFEN